MLNSKVLELLLYGSDTESVSNRRINFECFARFIELFKLGLGVDSSHIMKSVAKLDDNNANILRHRNKHFSDVFSLELFLRNVIDFSELCNSVNKHCYRFAEIALYVIYRKVGILDRIVKQSSCDRFRVHTELRCDTCY